MINAGLLAVLLVAALTTQNEITPSNTLISDAPHQLPKFDDTQLFSELPNVVHEPIVKSIEIPIVLANPEPLQHQLPPLVAEAPPLPPAPAVVAAPVISPTTQMPLNQITVKKGDSLEKIAKANHTTVDQILKLNNLSNSLLKIGQVLKIPTERTLTKAPEKKTTETGPEYYTMKVGDNPWAIAMKHHMKVEELLRLNGLNEERARKLKAGDRLRTR
jgi:LysM repeat protein